MWPSSFSAMGKRSRPTNASNTVFFIPFSNFAQNLFSKLFENFEAKRAQNGSKLKTYYAHVS